MSFWVTATQLYTTPKLITDYETPGMILNEPSMGGLLNYKWFVVLPKSIPRCLRCFVASLGRILEFLYCGHHGPIQPIIGNMAHIGICSKNGITKQAKKHHPSPDISFLAQSRAIPWECFTQNMRCDLLANKRENAMQRQLTSFMVYQVGKKQ